MKFLVGSKDKQITIDFREYLDGLYSYAVVLSRNRTQADDLVQETCLRALRAMHRLRSDSNVKSWLFTILRNIWFNQLRHSRMAREVDGFDLAQHSTKAEAVSEPAEDPYAIYLRNTERDQVRTAIQQLPLEFREVVLLREYQELSYEEIATLLGCPVGTVMSRLARARSKLRDSLMASSTQRDAGVEGEGSAVTGPAGDV
jgi:RNA polymerase sigma-70 factor, ECF subfamily